MKSLLEIVQIKEAAEKELLGRSGVTGVDVGFKYVKGEKTPELAIRILVEKKKKQVAKGEAVPEAIEGVKTDVIERVFKLHQTNRLKVEDITLMADTTTYDPVKGGISIGPCRSVGGYVFAGTLGAIVKDNVTNNPMLLSNFHVMCVDDGWHVGDQMCQPSRVDTGSCPANQVGTLQRAALTNSVDAAICSLSGRAYSCSIVDIGDVAGTATATLNLAVRKRGRTTGLTYGNVDSISLTVNIDYGDGLGPKTLTNQIGISPDVAHNPKFGDHGDSGSVVVDGNRKVVGLYFAGSDDGYGVANPIAAVLSTLNVSMCTPFVKIREVVGKSFAKDIKELRKEKIEIKESKIEIKERKPEKLEYEVAKPTPDFQPKLSDGMGPLIPTEPITPIQPIAPSQPLRPAAPGSALEQRVAQLEATLQGLTTFITAGMRPDLSTGALTQEQDMAQKLQKDAADATQAKVDFDTKACDR